MEQFIGCDSCSAGWMCFIFDSDMKWQLKLFQSVRKLWSSYSQSNLVLIDMPIGLRNDCGKPRICDKEARKYLTRKRSSSIFPTPCREILTIKDYHQANKRSKKKCGKGISKQTWNIIPEIIEVDEFLQNNEKVQNIFIECHPEVCFAALNKDNPLEYYKKTEKEIEERLDLLMSYMNYDNNPLKTGLQMYKRKDVAVDDILDAWVLGLSASLGRKNFSYLPEDYEYDVKGLPMRIAKPHFFDS
jgi:predicted RNase H-like nuclease